MSRHGNQASPAASRESLLEEITARHDLDPSSPIIGQLLQQPELLGLTPEDLAGKKSKQARDLVAGEYLALVAREAGRVASELLFRAQWGYREPDWFDHRHHFLNPDRHCADFWTLSVDNIVRVLPRGGTLLNLCSGDGFYDYHFFRKRAKEIVCIDLNPECYRQSVRLHSADNIRFIHGDLLEYDPPKGHFDVVAIRGAIEHFSEENQGRIFEKVKAGLKPGGWFCGDTVANPDDSGGVLLGAHDCEWKNEPAMREALKPHFGHIETASVTSKERITLLWRCQV